MQSTQPTTPPPLEETGNKKVVINWLQFIGVLLFAITSTYYIVTALFEKEDKLREEIVKVSDNLTALDASIKSVESFEALTTQRVNGNFTKVQGRLESIERTIKTYVPPSSTISDIPTSPTEKGAQTAKQ